jgi:hypothetical protein
MTARRGQSAYLAIALQATGAASASLAALKEPATRQDRLESAGQALAQALITTIDLLPRADATDKALAAVLSRWVA